MVALSRRAFTFGLPAATAAVTSALSPHTAFAEGQAAHARPCTYAPGGSTPRHHHSDSVYAYVLSGAIRSENSATGAVQIYRAGESFFEPPGSIHLISENASRTEPASLLAVFVAEDGATLTTVDK